MNRRELLMGVAATAIAGVPPEPRLVYVKALRTIVPLSEVAGRDLIVGQTYNIIFDGTSWLIEGRT